MSPSAIREQLKVSKDQGSKVKSILRKLVLKKLILQKGNLFGHSDLRTRHQHKKKKSFENPRNPFENLRNPSKIQEIHGKSKKSIENLRNPLEILEIHGKSKKSIEILEIHSKI